MIVYDYSEILQIYSRAKSSEQNKHTDGNTVCLMTYVCVCVCVCVFRCVRAFTHWRK